MEKICNSAYKKFANHHVKKYANQHIKRAERAVRAALETLNPKSER